MAVVGGDIGYSNDKGKVFCNRNILLSVINLAAKEINGVAELAANFGGSFRLFRRRAYEGVRIDFAKDGINVDLYLKVFNNVSVPEVASKVQENVKNGIASMLDIKVKTINVNIVGTFFPSEI